MRVFLFIGFVSYLVSGLPLAAQDMQRVRQTIDTLCSPYMGGRGYVDSGDHRATRYLAAQYADIGLQPFDKHYLQHFTIPVNTFPGAVLTAADSDTLVPGADYLVLPFSGSGAGTYPVTPLPYLDTVTRQTIQAMMQQRYPGQVLYIDKDRYAEKKYGIILHFLKASDGLGAEAVLVHSKEKMTWRVADTALAIPFIQVTREALEQRPDSFAFTISNAYYPAYRTQNVIGYLEGHTYPDAFLVFTAHYDHLGRMGADTYFPGANDNASGTAMLLELARHYADPANRPPCSVAFMAFGAEEAGILGSEYYTKNPMFPLAQIQFLLNLDLLGGSSKGITVVNGKIHEAAYDTLVALNERFGLLPDIKARGKARNSDHYYFTEAGVPAFFIYTRGDPTAYHDIYDRPEALPLEGFVPVFRLLNYFVEAMGAGK